MLKSGSNALLKYQAEKSNVSGTFNSKSVAKMPTAKDIRPKRKATMAATP